MSRMPARIAPHATFTAPAHMRQETQVETAVKSVPVWVYFAIGAFIGLLINIVVL